ncbi:hypothetical protein Trydic_g11762 [Trypoxylus dichotomus]
MEPILQATKDPSYSRCHAPNCRNNAKDNYNLSFFRFPKLLNRCKIWIANAKLANRGHLSSEYCYRNLRVCSEHFEEQNVNEQSERNHEAQRHSRHSSVSSESSIDSIPALAGKVAKILTEEDTKRKFDAAADDMAWPAKKAVAKNTETYNNKADPLLQYFNVEVCNRYGILADKKEEMDTHEEVQPSRQPPRFASDNPLVYFKKMEDYKKFIERYANKVPFYTYTPRTEKSGVPHQGTPPRYPIFMITIPKTVTLKHLQARVRYLQNMKVYLEPYRSKKEIIQSKKCKAWGHATANCFLRVTRCVKCAEEHRFFMCDKDREQPARCCKCSGDHAASCARCPAYKKLLAEKQRKTQTNTQRKTAPQVNYVPAPLPARNAIRTRTLPSDHAVLEFSANSVKAPADRVRIPNYSKVNWQSFRTILNEVPIVSDIPDIETLDSLVAAVGTMIRQAAEKMIPRKTIDPYHYNELPMDILNFIRSRNRIRKLL